MSKWKEISRGAKKMASKAISKTGDLSDTASLKLKLKRKQAFLADLYEQFGRIAYQKMKTGAAGMRTSSTMCSGFRSATTFCGWAMPDSATLQTIITKIPGSCGNFNPRTFALRQ